VLSVLAGERFVSLSCIVLLVKWQRPESWPIAGIWHCIDHRRGSSGCWRWRCNVLVRLAKASVHTTDVDQELNVKALCCFHICWFYVIYQDIIALQAILQLCITPVFTGLSLIAIMYGFMYHMFVGWLLCAFGAMIGAIWVFLLVRYFFRNALITKYGDTKWCQVALMAMREKAFIYSFLLRMTQLHFGMTTLVCAVRRFDSHDFYVPHSLV